MPFKTSYDSALGMPSITLSGVDTVKRVALGTIVKGYDDTLGEAEFIYLPGAANVVAGDWVMYDLLPSAPTVTRLTSALGANKGRPVAVAVAATGAGTYGWYQVGGVAAANVLAAFAAGSTVFTTATGGSVDDTAVAGGQILGAFGSGAIGTPAAAQAYVTLNRPFLQGQIT